MKRLQEVNVDDGTWVRFVGVGVLEDANRVHCSDTTIAVSEQGIETHSLVGVLPASRVATVVVRRFATSSIRQRGRGQRPVLVAVGC